MEGAGRSAGTVRQEITRKEARCRLSTRQSGQQELEDEQNGTGARDATCVDYLRFVRIAAIGPLCRL
jgi:hypothetical protein